MNICPLCNGLRALYFYCPHCQTEMQDEGKVTDYFGPYSPYMETDLLKQADGYKTTWTNHECVHLFYCPHCQEEEVRFIKE
jgi:hypothetical protein